MKPIPTAEEVYNDFHFNYKGDENSILEAMREYARLHVKRALEVASKKTTYGMMVVPLFNENQQESILNAYPDEKIK